MCPPIIIAGVAAMGMAMQYMSIQNQNKIAEDQYEAQIESARAAAQTDYYLLNTKSEQLNEQYETQATERMRQGMRERAKIRVAMGESGLQGNTYMKELSTSLIAEVFDTGKAYENLQHEQLGVEGEKMQVATGMTSRYTDASVKARSMSVDPFLGYMQITGAGLQSGMSAYAASKYANSDKTPKT